MAEMQKVIDAENSDLFDVLAYVAFTMPPITREVRASAARNRVHDQFDYRQQQFIEFVLGQYVKQGVGELDQEKLSPLLKLKYRDAIQDAVSDLGPAEEIRAVFVGFQKYLYLGEPAPRQST
ncbi:MAG: hypothetical protein H6979_06790 [Chromatiales bacterium]|nr:hypothetical protein [Chromatiales bacterium]